MSAEFSPLPTHAAITTTADLLRSRTGLSFGPNRLAALEAGIGRALARSGVSSLEAYADALRAEEPRGGRLLDDLLVEVTVGETYFFRDPQHFELLRKEVLPDLLLRQSDGSPLRFWSAGCATGEEPYSLAILLEEEGLADRARIVATDICRTAISKARDGVYGKWSLRGSDEAFTCRYFARQNDRFRLDPRFRERVAFEYMNLALDSYPSFALDVWGIDVILCRNVMIYFDEETIQRVARCLFNTLAEGGWLITGPSDPPLADHAPFETVVTSAGVFYRREGLDHQFGHQRPSSGASRHLLPRAGEGMSSRAGEGTQSPLPLAGEGARRAGESGQPGLLAQTMNRAVSPRPRPAPVPLLDSPPDGPAACVLRVKALANSSGARLAAETAAQDAARFPLSAELHFLHAVLLISLGRDEEAARVLRCALYLDRSLTVAHFVLGLLLSRRGDVNGALASYRNARDLAAKRPFDELLPFSDGEPAGRLAEAAAVEMALLNPSREVAS